jgi:N-methylhydantoinase B
MAGQSIDPITLQVINGALQTIAEEMGHVLYRMSFSSIIRESQDLGAGLFDTDFNTLCESESTPLHIGSLPGYLAGIAETLQDGEWHDGDVVIHNHPYHGSSHSPDIAVVVPVFHDGALVGYSANTAHHLDIGAATPGLIIDIPDVPAPSSTSGASATRRCGISSAATAAPRGNCRTISTPRSRRRASAPGASAS